MTTAPPETSLPSWAAQDLAGQVRAALAEDVGSGDLTAALIPAQQQARARLITREDAVLCGCAWVEEVFRQLGGQVDIRWHYGDGDLVPANATICELTGAARQILTGERTAMNFLQTLSGTATAARRFADAVQGKHITILDTRKTIPGLRGAQKYAVLCGGCQNHRIGLYDAFLIKENHIAACGSIAAAINAARKMAPDRKVIIEVESLAQLEQALACSPDQIMLDNFSMTMIEKALALAGEQCAIEVSGGISLEDLGSLTFATPVYVSVGALTKHVQSVDLSLRLDETGS